MMTLTSTLSRFQTAKQRLRFARDLPRLANFAKINPSTLIGEWANSQPHATALLFEERSFNWAQLNAEVDRWANWLISRNVRSGQVMVVLMGNAPEYIFLTMALNRIGAIASLINTNLRGEALRHSLRASNAHHLFMDSEHRPIVDGALSDDTPLPREAMFVLEDETTTKAGLATPILDELRAAAPKLRANNYSPRNSDIFCYIFTSGTTGLPKAAIIRNQRMLGAAYLFARDAPSSPQMGGDPARGPRSWRGQERQVGADG